MRKLLALIALVATLGVVATPACRAYAAPVPAAMLQHVAATDTPTILVDPVQGPSVSQQLVTRARASWPWYITRAAGFVAAISLALLMLSGVGFITGLSFKLLEPLTAWATHKAIAYIFGISVVVHVVALLFDKFVPFTIAQTLVPFLSHYREVSIVGYRTGSLYVALGVIALYFVLAIILSSILWIDKKPHTWKLLHFLAYLTIIFVFFHALYLGTDLAHGVFRIIWVIIGVGIAIAVVLRLRRRARM